MKMKINCPVCNELILEENINHSSDSSFCLKCKSIYNLSDKKRVFEFVPEKKPERLTIEETENGFFIETIVRAKNIFFIIPFSIFWLGLFVGIYIELTVNLIFDLEHTLFFGIPVIFFLILCMIFIFMSIYSKINIRVENNQGKIFIGIGNIGWIKKFNWKEVESISEEIKFNRSFSLKPANKNILIEIIDTEEEIRFGSNLSGFQRYYIIQALNKFKTKGHL